MAMRAPLHRKYAPMTSPHGSRRPSPPRIVPRGQGEPTRVRFTSPESAAAHRADVVEALHQFPSEDVYVEEAPAPVVAVIVAAPSPVAPPNWPALAARGRRSLLWLAMALAVGAPVVWTASQWSTGEATAPAAPSTSHSLAASATPAPSGPVADPVRIDPVATTPVAPAAAPVPVARERGRDRARSRAVSRQPAQARRTSETRETRPTPPAPRSAPAVARTPAQATPPAVAAAVAPAPGFRGSVVIESSPVGAHVFVNGRPVGSTPLELQDLPAGSRAIRIEADGYQSWSSAIRVIADQQVRVTATLQRTAIH